MDIIAIQSSWANSLEINPGDNTKEEKLNQTCCWWLTESPGMALSRNIINYEKSKHLGKECYLRLAN